MRCYRYGEGRLRPALSLWEALEVSWRPHMVISLVGAGGKTSVMDELADELAAMGKSVIITTTTHILCPEKRRVLLSERAGEIGREVRRGEVLVVGRRDPENGGKLIGILPDETGKLAELADVLLIEADGARKLPLKVPGEKEPVLIPETGLVIGCCGLDCIGERLRDCCFRSEMAGKLLGVMQDHRVSLKDAARILTSRGGAKKGLENREYRIVLNKADGERERELAIELIGEICRIEVNPCVVTSFSKLSEL